jgi:hypothetical protein
MTPPRRHSAARSIAVYCDAESHPRSIGEIEIGTLTSVITDGKDSSVEAWDADGPHVIVQRTVPAEVARKRPGVARVAAGIAGRYRFRCPACGHDVVAGDRFGGRNTQIGFSAFVAAGADVDLVDSDEIGRRVAVGFATWRRLTELADNGVSRLSMAGLQVIFQMQ